MAAHFFADIPRHALLATSIAPATISTLTDTDGTAVDCLGTDGSIYGIYLTGECGDATTTIVISLIESETSSGTYTAVSGASVSFSGSATANDNLTGIIKGLRTKRWVKARVTTAVGTASCVIGVCILGDKKITPSTANGAQL